MSHITWPYQNGRFSLSSELNEAYFTEGFLSGMFEVPNSFGSWWNNGEGIFLFLKSTEAALDVPGLEKKLVSFLGDPINADTKILWIENPNDPLLEWRSNSLAWKHIGEEKRIVSRLSYIDIRNYGLSIAAGSEVEMVVDQDYWRLEIKRAADNPFGFELSTDYGHERWYDLGDTVTLYLKNTIMGCLGFGMEVKLEGDKDTGYHYPALKSLDMGQRIFFRDPDFPERGNEFYFASHRYPLLQESADHPQGHAYFPPEIDFHVLLDPLYPLVAQRSRVQYQPLKDQAAITGLPSAFRSNLGYYVHLIPQHAGCMFQFALRPALPGDEHHPRAPLYLTPAGDFQMVIPRYKEDGSVDLIPEANVVCGISGVEYIRMSMEPPTYISFVPGQPAFAAGHVSVSSLLRDLPTIIEQFSNRPLPPDTRDLDIPIEDTQEGEAVEALDITDEERRQILDIVRQDYFPPGYVFSDSQLEQYDGLELIEDLIDWLQDALQTAQISGTGSGTPLEAFPTTSWTYVRDKVGSVYYAQPDQAVLYRAESSSKQFLDYLEVPSVGLPDKLTEGQAAALKASTGLDTLAFPMLPYGNLPAGQLTDIRLLEIALLNNFRRNRIQRISDATDHVTPLKAAGETNVIGTTPQGLVAEFSADCKTIQQLHLAKDTKNKVIPFVGIEHGSPLKAALQSNQLFMVVTDPEAVRPYFDDEVLAALPGATNSMDIQDWLFELGPDEWKKQGTIMVFKFHDKPLLELAGNADFWSLPDSFNQGTAAASRSLVRLLKEAVEKGNSADPKVRRKYEVLARAATQPNWTGILALNVHVPLRNLPDQLKALAAGMNPDLFYSQFVGVEVTQVTSTGETLVSQQSSLFGLIDYSNPLVPLADPSGYNFHVPSLTVVFQNAQITDFAAEVLVIMDKLFDEKTKLYNSPDGRNILRLQGVAEEHNGKVTYSFGFSGANHFLLSGKNLEEIEIYKAQFVTDPIADRNADPQPVRGRFFFWGRIRFAYQPELDVLSFGSAPGTGIAPPPQPGQEPAPPDYLNLSNLQIVMGFDLLQENNSVENLNFEFNPRQMAFDLERSGWRKQSLYEKFPLKFSGFRYVQDDANALANSGFMPVSTPSKDASLTSTWYGITYELNLGSVGALAGSAGIVVSLLIAWSPEKEGLYIGLKLPGSSGGKREISIQGLLKIVFKKIQLVVYPLDPEEDLSALPPDTEREVGYLLKIKNITLKFFSVSFPPSGQTELTLFGDPRDNVERDDKLLGWYGAYAR